MQPIHRIATLTTGRFSRTSQVLAFSAALFFGLARTVLAETFIHNIDMNKDRTTYLFGTENVEVVNEVMTASTKYWSPIGVATVGSVTYGYNFSAPIETASIYANLLTHSSPDQIWLDVSSDNVNFTNLFYQVGPGGGGQGLHPQSVNPGLPPRSFDLTSHLSGSTTAYIRARMQGYTAQFMRTADFLPGFEAPNVYQFTATTQPVPEPSTYAMALAGVACGGYSMWRRRKRA